MRAFLIPAAILVAFAAGASSAKASEDKPSANAALCYWQAFTFMPDSNRLSKQERDYFFGIMTAPLDKTYARIVDRSEQALRHLHRGARLRRCDWGLDPDEMPFMREFSYCSKAQELAQLACLRARYHFEQNRHDAALEDLSATLLLARHVGADAGSYPKIAEGHIETLVLRLAALYLPRLPPETRRRLQTRLDAVPESTPWARAARKERDTVLAWFPAALRRQPRDVYWMLVFSPEGGLPRASSNPVSRTVARGLELLSLDDWFERDPKTRLAYALAEAIRDRRVLDRTLTEAGELLDEWVKIQSLPLHQQDAAAFILRDRIEKARPLTRALVLSTCGATLNGKQVRRIEAMRAMLRAAIAVVRDGPDAVRKFADPFGSGPFQYRRLEGAFELRSALRTDSWPARLIVGRVLLGDAELNVQPSGVESWTSSNWYSWEQKAHIELRTGGAPVNVKVYQISEKERKEALEMPATDQQPGKLLVSKEKISTATFQVTIPAGGACDVLITSTSDKETQVTVRAWAD